MSDIKLHPKYGLNPTIPTCFFCGKDKNEVMLLGAAYRGEAPMRIGVVEDIAWDRFGLPRGEVKANEADHDPTEQVDP